MISLRKDQSPAISSKAKIHARLCRFYRRDARTYSRTSKFSTRKMITRTDPVIFYVLVGNMSGDWRNLGYSGALRAPSRSPCALSSTVTTIPMWAAAPRRMPSMGTIPACHPSGCRHHCLCYDNTLKPDSLQSSS